MSKRASDQARGRPEPRHAAVRSDCHVSRSSQVGQGPSHSLKKGAFERGRQLTSLDHWRAVLEP